MIPQYNGSKSEKATSFAPLPAGGYVAKIVGARIENYRCGDRFDLGETPAFSKRQQYQRQKVEGYIQDHHPRRKVRVFQQSEAQLQQPDLCAKTATEYHFDGTKNLRALPNKEWEERQDRLDYRVRRTDADERRALRSPRTSLANQRQPRQQAPAGNNQFDTIT